MVGIGLFKKKMPLAECSMRDIDANGCTAPATLMVWNQQITNWVSILAALC
jgi:hypothetical protein